MRPYQVQPKTRKSLRVRVDLGVMEPKGLLHIPQNSKKEASLSDAI